MTNNCYYLGLLEKKGQYKDALITKAYLSIKEKCLGNFKNTDLYSDLIISQIEKIFLSNPVDNEHDGLRKNFKIHPAFYLAKVLIQLGDITGEYRISLSEFKKFVGTSLNYSYHLTTTSLIIESRSNKNLLEDIRYIVDFYDDISNINDANFQGNRLNLLLKNLPYYNMDENNIYLQKKFLDEIRFKLAKYECKLDDKNIFTSEFLNSNNQFENKLIAENNETKLNKKINIKNEVQQIIFFGPPGTGKSYNADLITEGHEVRKVTFHPDYDYISFIGGYKPTKNKDKNISYEFVPQIFTKLYIEAWKNPDKIYFLQIEEINRGNCAEIFGDFFQLLDRDNNGFSKYQIDADEELRKFLTDIYHKDAFQSNEHDGIKNGKLSLPSNFNIIATMNTSDQSLFPMDTAFKRRWDWEYVPINYNCDKSNFIIELNNSHKFLWLDFLKKINELIFNITFSQDKQIGNWFVVPQNTDHIITESVFLNKVLFYLWNDIFKDEDTPFFKTADYPNLSYATFFEIENRSFVISQILTENLKISLLNH
jgi:hypothetical protein